MYHKRLKTITNMNIDTKMLQQFHIARTSCCIDMHTFAFMLCSCRSIFSTFSRKLCNFDRRLYRIHNRTVHWIHAALAQSQFINKKREREKARKTMFCVIVQTWFQHTSIHKYSHTHSTTPCECNRFDVTKKFRWKMNSNTFFLFSLLHAFLDERKADDEPARNLHQLSYLSRNVERKMKLWINSSEIQFHSLTQSIQSVSQLVCVFSFHNRFEI